MKNVKCNNSSLVCYNHFRQCDYRVQGKRWKLNFGVVPSQFKQDVEEEREIDDSMSNDETLKRNGSVEETEQFGGQNEKLERLQAENLFWKEQCMSLKEQLLKAQQKNDELNLISSNELTTLEVNFIIKKIKKKLFFIC